ncbi:choice-of-anchor J domain-containing protein [Bacteroidales bacterium OttesenSCG-928-C03]|nr:choice-of-anchor J domain-containing protein [Bacteroidales bacterium OttesenSCG-928-E04]MDL2309261.1 choice-of-anchor J domain-containing protein [Bacteroidales bacterium OttesenSCG-928-C03]MDL2326574.1 choice-of-anchor J domain-containing protein [Bacteroidales bacterium OttesenSCG-928-A14]
MKKFLSVLIALFIVFSMNAQNADALQGKKITQDRSSITNPKSNSMRMDVPLKDVNKPVSQIVPQNRPFMEKHGKATTTITSFPWTEGFEGAFPPAGWTLIDNDDDGFGWDTQIVSQSGSWIDVEGYNSAHAAVSASYLNLIYELTPDNWLITPALQLSENAYDLKYWVGAVDVSYYAEHYEVMISTTGTDVTDFTSVFQETLTTGAWQERTISLSAYSGQTIHIAFVHNQSSDIYVMRIDDVTVVENVDIDAQVFSIPQPVSGESLTATETVKAAIRNNGISAISNFPLTLMVNGATVATETYSGSIAAGAQAEYTFTAKANLSAVGAYEIKVIVNLPNDESAGNDTLTKNIANFASDPVTLYGYRIYDDQHEAIQYEGIASFSSSNPAVVTMANTYTDGDNNITGGGYYDGDVYMYSRTQTSQTTYEPANFIKLPTSSWTAVALPIAKVCNDMAYDYKTNTMYGITIESSTTNLYTIDLATGAMTLVGNMGITFYTLACNTKGDMFGVSTSGDFYAVDKATGNTTFIAKTGISPVYIQTMAFDHNTGRLFWAMCNAGNEGKLIEINPTNGAIFDRGTIAGNAEIVALYTPYTYVAPEITVLDTTPSNSAINIELNAAVKVTFSEDITAADLSGITITPDPGNVSATVSGAVLTIAHNDFAYKTEYTVTVPAGAIDDFDEAITWKFTTKDNVGVDLYSQNVIKIYPNPSNGLITISVIENSMVKIHDITGRLLESQRIDTGETTLNISQAAGVYILRVESESGKVSTHKLVIK